MLKKRRMHYQEMPIDGDQVKRQEMIQKSKRLTVPQIWIGNKHVGGWNELFALDCAGKLDPLLAASSRVSETQ